MSNQSRRNLSATVSEHTELKSKIRMTKSFSNSLKSTALNEQIELARKQLRDLVDKVEKVSPEEQWRLVSLERKTTMYGYKGRLKWQQIKFGVWVVFKLSFYAYFFKSNPKSSADLIIELEELNFPLAQHERKSLQFQLENAVQKTYEITKKSHQNSEEERKHIIWLQILLVEISKIILANQLSKRVSVEPYKINFKTNSQRYIPYPVPVAFCWNPLGNICITENQFPSFRKSFIADPISFARNIEPPKMNSQISTFEQPATYESVEQKADAIFDWEEKEEIEFIILKREEHFQQTDHIYIDDRKIQTSDLKPRPLEEGKSVILSYHFRVHSQSIRQIFERYFMGDKRPQPFNREDKLKVYEVINSNHIYEDEMTYLLEKIRISKQLEDESDDQRAEKQDSAVNSIFRAVMSSELSLYEKIFNGPLNRLRYSLALHHLRQRIEKAHPDTFALNLKAVIIQNQYFQVALQQHFTQLYKAIQSKPPISIKSLASYNRFDQPKSEAVFMDILQKYLNLQNNSKNLKDGAKVHIRIKRKLYPMSFEWILSNSEKNVFLMSLFPVLIVKDRQMEKLELRQVKRIIAANAKMMQFVGKMNIIATKFEANRLNFLSAFVLQHRKNAAHTPLCPPRRVFVVYCQKCQRATNIFQLQQYESARQCSECRDVSQ